MPVITPFPTASPAPASFFLFADLETQALALAKHVGTEGRAIHVIHDGTPAARAAMKPSENAKRSDGDLLFLIGAGVDVPSVLRELKSSRWKPRILIAGAPVTAEVFDAEPPILIAAPALPSDLTEEGRREIIAFAERHALPTEQLAPHIATLAAVKVLVEGVKRSGRELTREKLIASLEQLYQFSTGMTPPVSFARNRHVGTSSVHMLAVDREKRAFVAAKR